jgi:hypothetical protein
LSCYQWCKVGSAISSKGDDRTGSNTAQRNGPYELLVIVVVERNPVSDHSPVGESHDGTSRHIREYNKCKMIRVARKANKSKIAGAKLSGHPIYHMSRRRQQNIECQQEVGCFLHGFAVVFLVVS